MSGTRETAKASGPQIPRFLLLDAGAGLLVNDLPLAIATGAWGLAVVLSAAAASPILWSGLVLPLVLAVAARSALQRGAERIRDRFESRFWRDLQIAALFFAMAVVAGLPSHLPAVPASLWLHAPSGCLLFLAYSRLLLATELQPHRDGFWRSEQLERRLSLVTLTTFGVGIFGYFAVIPALISGRAADAGVAVAYLFALMAGLLFVRLGLFGYFVKDLRWRSIYRVMAAAALVAGLFHACQALYWTAPDPAPGGVGKAYLWSLSLVLWIFAVRLRHHPFPADWRPVEPDPDEADDPVAQNQLGLDFRTLLLALGGPMLHLVGYRFDILLASAEGVREVWLLFWTAALATLAVVQQRISSDRLETVLGEQRRITRTLAAGERRLQMVEERKAADEALYYSREKYAKAFRSGPFALVVLRAADGSHVDVNDRYVEMLGLSRTALEQRPFPSLLVGDGAAQWSTLEARLETRAGEGGDETVEDLVEIVNAAGEIRRLGVTVEPLDTQEGPCRLLICTDLSDEQDRREEGRRQTERLDHAADPAMVFDRRGSLVWMNRRAVDLFGPLPEPTVGQLGRYIRPGPELTAADLATREGRQWMGRLAFCYGAEQASELDCWWLPIRRKGRERQDRLILLLTPQGGGPAVDAAEGEAP